MPQVTTKQLFETVERLFVNEEERGRVWANLLSKSQRPRYLLGTDYSVRSALRNLVPSSPEFREGLLAARKCLPGGDSKMLGSTKVLTRSWKKLDTSGEYERFWEQHRSTFQNTTYFTKQCDENPTDVPAYISFAELLSQLAKQIAELLCGANLVVNPSFLVPPQSTLLKSAGSDDDLTPDVIWSSQSGLSADNCEMGGNVFGELQTYLRDENSKRDNFKEANGQLVKIGSLLFGRILEKYRDSQGPYEMTGIASDGRRVQICYLSFVEGDQPERYQTDILDFSGRRRRGRDNFYEINTESEGFREIVFAIFKRQQGRYERR